MFLSLEVVIKVFGKNLLAYKIVYKEYFKLDQEKTHHMVSFSNLMTTSTNPSNWEDGYLVKKRVNYVS